MRLSWIVRSVVCFPVLFSFAGPALALTQTASQSTTDSGGWSAAGTDKIAWNAPKWLEFAVDFGSGGSWMLGLTAKNENTVADPGLPAGYSFNIAVTVDGVSKGSFNVPGSTTAYQTGTLTSVAVASGTHTVRFTWTNDAWAAGQYDANIRVKEVSFEPPAPPAQQTVATPTLNPAGGVITGGSVAVTLSTTTSGAQIRYTTDGSTPTNASPLYSGTPISITSPSTVKAVALKTGMSDSAIATASFGTGSSSSTVITRTAAESTAQSTGWTAAGTDKIAWNASKWLEYQLDFGSGGSWTIALAAKNEDTVADPGLPAGYSFNIALSVDGGSQGSFNITGSSTAFQTGSKAVTMASGSHTVRFTWTNDAWAAGQYDANIRIKDATFTGSGGTSSAVMVSPADGLPVEATSVLAIKASGLNSAMQPFEYQVLLDDQVISNWSTTVPSSWTPALTHLGKRRLTIKVRNTSLGYNADVTNDLFVIRTPVQHP